VPLSQQALGTNLAYWLGTLLELKLQVLEGRDVNEEQAMQLSTLKPSQLNRLQRSMVRDRVPVVAKDSTVSVASFLRETLDGLNRHLQDTVDRSSDWRVNIHPQHLIDTC
jgi:hypothetical protein